MNRRESLKLLSVASFALVLPGCTRSDIDRAAERTITAVSDGLENRSPTALNAHQFQTVSRLADYIIPADDRSGSATEAHVPEFIDFLLEDVPDLQAEVLEGLAWLDGYCTEQFGATFLSCSAENQVAVLDRIAYPAETAEELSEGARFFSRMRDMTASGFFTSSMGMEDVGYMGNVARPTWSGCPDPALDHLGLSYES